jgi:hypothetical protein
MWVDGDGEVFGLAIDEETHLLRWYASPGCSCGNESAADQSIAQYRQRGVPGQVADPPADVLSEIQEAVRMLEEASIPGKAQALWRTGNG